MRQLTAEALHEKGGNWSTERSRGDDDLEDASLCAGEGHEDASSEGAGQRETDGGNFSRIVDKGPGQSRKRETQRSEGGQNVDIRKSQSTAEQEHDQASDVTRQNKQVDSKAKAAAHSIQSVRERVIQLSPAFNEADLGFRDFEHFVLGGAKALKVAVAVSGGTGKRKVGSRTNEHDEEAVAVGGDVGQRMDVLEERNGYVVHDVPARRAEKKSRMCVDTKGEEESSVLSKEDEFQEESEEIVWVADRTYIKAMPGNLVKRGLMVLPGRDANHTGRSSLSVSASKRAGGILSESCVKNLVVDPMMHKLPHWTFWSSIGESFAQHA